MQGMATNDTDTKPSRIHVKKPLSTANFLQNNSSTNGFSNQIKKRTLQLNNFFHSKRKSPNTIQQSEDRSPPLVFHAIAPVPSQEVKELSEDVKYEQKVFDFISFSITIFNQ